MAQEPTDDELRSMMRTLSAVVGIPLSEERIEVALPAYRSFLANVRDLERVDIPVELEPALTFDLSRGWQA